MSYCISINGIENLPLEQTLLIHYSILCTGTWYYSELLNGYRNVCDTEWTVMYPNHQHPRHTDLPITLTSPNYQGIFAWNYGGIPGISPEDFDETHSYLVQLGIFNYDCYNTGQPPTSTGQNPVTGSNTGSPTGIPTITGGFPGGPIQRPRWPNGGTPPNAPVETPPGGGVGNPGQGTMGGATGEPTGIVIVSQDTYTGGGTIGQQDPVGSVPVYNLTQYYTSTPTQVSAPSTTTPGGLVNANLVFSPASTSTVNQNINIGGSVYYDPNVGTSLILNGVNYSQSSSTVSTNSNNYNSYIDIVLLNTVVRYGTPIVASIVFSPPSEMSARVEVSLQDNTRSVVVGGTGLVNCGPSNNLTCGITTNSSIYNLGTIVVLVKIFDASNTIVGIKSVLVNLIEQNSGEGYTASETLPSEIINNTLAISTTPIEIELLENNTRYLILSSESNQNNISLLLNTDYGNKDSYGLAVYPITNWATQVSGKYILGDSTAESTSKFKINDQEIYETSHTVGINSGQLSGSVCIIEIAPTFNNESGDTNGRLYVSTNYKLRPYSYTNTSTSLTINTPYAIEELGLIVNGPISGVIDPSYTMYKALTSISGSVTFSGISWNVGDYFSVLQGRKGTINPFSKPIYIGRR